MTFKERKEFESLAGEIADLEKEKREIEEMLNSGNLGVEELTQKSQRISEVLALLDEKKCAGWNCRKSSEWQRAACHFRMSCNRIWST